MAVAVVCVVAVIADVDVVVDVRLDIIQYVYHLHTQTDTNICMKNNTTTEIARQIHKMFYDFIDLC